jgi:hypothetical protein
LFALRGSSWVDAGGLSTEGGGEAGVAGAGAVGEGLFLHHPPEGGIEGTGHAEHGLGSVTVDEASVKGVESGG